MIINRESFLWMIINKEIFSWIIINNQKFGRIKTRGYILVVMLIKAIRAFLNPFYFFYERILSKQNAQNANK